jgi:acyl homoserine lactone synthase
LAGLESLVAIFDARMLRKYKRVGVEPEVIGAQTYSFGIAQAGLWSFDAAKYQALLQASEIDKLELELVIANAKLPWKIPVNATQSQEGSRP